MRTCFFGRLQYICMYVGSGIRIYTGLYTAYNYPLGLCHSCEKVSRRGIRRDLTIHVLCTETLTS